MTSLKIGFVPLVDCAPLIVAKELHFAEAEGLSLTLNSEQSWSNIRDKLAIGSIDAAHLLSPLALATTLGLSGLKVDIAAPLVLSRAGQVVCLAERHRASLTGMGTGTRAVGEAIRSLATERGKPLRFAVPFFFSMHHYLLRYWLSACGVDLDTTVKVDVVPPSFMRDAFLAGHIDGCVVGEPWGSLCVESRQAGIILGGDEIWPASPEKVLGLRRAFIEENPDKTASLIRAIWAAAKWADDPANTGLLSEIMARPDYLGQPAEIIERALSGSFTVNASGAQRLAPDLLSFFNGAAAFPWRSQARWIHAQMVRWDHARPTDAETAAQVFSPDILRRALRKLDADLPGANEKVEGALDVPTGVASTRGSLVLRPDPFFDGVVFDPGLHKFQT